MAEAGAEIVRPAIGVDARALVFALLISTGAALIFGLIPALYVAGADVNDALKAGGRTSSASAGRTRVWSLLVAGEVALASMLLIGAGLAMKSFVNLQHVNPGIRPDHVLTFRMRLPTDNLYKSDREQADFYRRVLDRVDRIPGIQSAGLTDVLPLGRAKRPRVLHHRKSAAAAGPGTGRRFSAYQPALSEYHGNRAAAGEAAFRSRCARSAAGDPDR